MAITQGHPIDWVAHLAPAAGFYRDANGLELKFSAPRRSGFATAAATLAEGVDSEDARVSPSG